MATGSAATNLNRISTSPNRINAMKDHTDASGNEQCMAIEALLALVAHRSGHHFWGIGTVPIEEIETSERLETADDGNLFLAVSYREPKESAHEEWIAMFDLMVTNELLVRILRGTTNPDHEDTVEMLLHEGEYWATRILAERESTQGHEELPDGRPGGDELVLNRTLQLLDYFCDPKKIRRLWLTWHMLRQGEFVPAWSLDVIEYLPVETPSAWFDIDWYQAGLREAINRRLKSV